LTLNFVKNKMVKFLLEEWVGMLVMYFGEMIKHRIHFILLKVNDNNKINEIFDKLSCINYD